VPNISDRQCSYIRTSENVWFYEIIQYCRQFISPNEQCKSTPSTFLRQDNVIRKLKTNYGPYSLVESKRHNYGFDDWLLVDMDVIVSDEALRQWAGSDPWHGALLHNYDKELMQETIGAAVEGCPATTNNNIGRSAPSHCGVCGSILPKSILFLKSQHLLVFRSSARALY
jgi:hypothetical protein